MQQQHHWLRDKDRRPIALIVSEDQGDTVRFAIAIANPKDKFNKEFGRRIALGRLEKGSEFTWEADKDHNAGQIVLSSIRDNAQLPARIRRAAAEWYKRIGERLAKQQSKGDTPAPAAGAP